MSSYYILRPIRDSMSSDWSDTELSLLYTATFLFSAIAVVLYGAVCSRIKMGRVIPGVYGFFALSFFLFYLAIRSPSGADLANKAFYVWTSVFSLFHVSVFWSLMSDIFTKHQATRLFAFIAAGGSAGAIAGPAISLGMVTIVGRTHLLLISALLLVIPVIIVCILGKLKHNEMHNGVIPAHHEYQQTLSPDPFAGFKLFITTPYLLGIGVFILLYTSISTFVYFELKNLMIGIEENMRIQIWAGMDLIVNVLTISTALTVTGRLAARFGLAVTLPLIPIVIVFGLLVVTLAPMLWVVAGLQVIRRSGNYSITRPAREMLYTVVDRESRFKAKSVIDILVYRGGDMTSAWIFTSLTKGFGLGLNAMAAVGACIALVWAMVAIVLGKSYDRNHMQARTTVTEQDLAINRQFSL